MMETILPDEVFFPAKKVKIKKQRIPRPTELFQIREYEKLLNTI